MADLVVAELGVLALVVAVAGLRYLTARSLSVVAATSFGRFKLFKIAFDSDGSIYIPFHTSPRSRAFSRRSILPRSPILVT